MIYIFIGLIVILIVYEMYLDFKMSKIYKEFKMFSSITKHNISCLSDCINDSLDHINEELPKKVSADDIVKMIDEVLKEDKRISKKGKIKIKKAIKKGEK